MMREAVEGIFFTNAERRLLLLFYSGNVSDTADTLREALADIYDSDERAAVAELIVKLRDMNEDALSDFIFESEEHHV